MAGELSEFAAGMGAGASLSAQSAGEGPAIVLLHGLTATRRYVVMGSRLLERSGLRVISYDARGHGRSDPAPAAGGYDYGELASDLEAVMDTAGADRAILAGASMGAHTAVRFALAHPARGADELARWDALARGLRESGVEGFLAAYDVDAVPARWRAVVETVLRQRLSAHEHPPAVADALESVPRSAPFERIEELEAVKAPTLVVGSRDEADPGHPLSVAELYAERIPGARLAVEEEGSPIAWQGGQLSRLLLDLAER
jgi:pimeloyl-ACP methyl ester carboxylesterase